MEEEVAADISSSPVYIPQHTPKADHNDSSVLKVRQPFSQLNYLNPSVELAELVFSGGTDCFLSCKSRTTRDGWWMVD